MNNEQRAWLSRGISRPCAPVVGRTLSAREALEQLRAGGRTEEATQLEAAMRSGDVEAVRSLLARV